MAIVGEGSLDGTREKNDLAEDLHLGESWSEEDEGELVGVVEVGLKKTKEKRRFAGEGLWLLVSSCCVMKERERRGKGKEEGEGTVFIGIGRKPSILWLICVWPCGAAKFARLIARKVGRSTQCQPVQAPCVRIFLFADGDE